MKIRVKSEDIDLHTLRVLKQHTFFDSATVLWSYGVELLLIVQQVGYNSRYFSRIKKKVIKSYVWNIIFWISTTTTPPGEVSAMWCVRISLREILRILRQETLWELIMVIN